MKTAVLGSVLAVAFTALAQEPEYLRHVVSATALLYAQNAEGSMDMKCTATAFAKTEKGYRFVSAAHCVAKDDETHERVEVKSPALFITFDESEGPKQFIKAKAVAVGYQHRGDDFAVLEIETPLTIGLVELGDDVAESVGAPVFNIASPMGLGWQVFHGYVSMMKLERPVIADEINWRNAMLIQISVGGGSSGSAIVSPRQKAIVAFLVGAISSGSSPNVVAIPVSKFKAFLSAVAAGKYRWFKPESAEQ